MRDPLLALSILVETRKSRKSIVWLLPVVALLMSVDAHASSSQPNAAEVQLALRKLGVAGSVLYVAAHPDDENTNLLTYLSKEKLVRTGYLSLTRGDGGQNLIGPEQGADLGVIRTQELLAARRLDGAEQFFTRARDFGYSKNPEETLRIWSKDAVLADVVYVIRRFRPDVIITRFSPEPTDTHGHHTASAQLALAAFHAAADPGFHPEQLAAGMHVWQARRILWNRSSWSIKPDDDLSGFLKMDVNAYNPLLGVSCGELAADSRSMHKSQGFGVARSRGPIVEYFKLLDQANPAAPMSRSFLDGLDLSFTRFKAPTALKRLLALAGRDFAPAAPHTIIPTLFRLDKALDALPDAGWRAKKQAEVRDLIVACAGLFAEAAAADFRVVPGHSLAVTATAINRSPASITLRALSFVGGDVVDLAGADSLPKPLGSVEIKKTFRVSPDLPLTTPYWLEQPPGPGLFHTPDATLTGLPEAASPLQVDFTFEIAGHPLVLRRAIDFKWTDPVAGERHRPLEIAPLLSVKPALPMLLSPNGEARALTVRLCGQAPEVSGTLRLDLPAGWLATPASVPFSLVEKGMPKEFTFRISPPKADKRRTSIGTLRAVAEVGGRKYASGVEHVEHAHIPVQAVLTNADVRLAAFPMERQGTRIGYIPGPGDEVPSALRQAGYEVTMIGDEVLGNLPGTGALLANFDAVVVGVRAFNTSEPLRSAQPALLAYVQAGGRLIVQYNTNNRLAPLTTPLGPFPLEIGRERVTDENAAVELLSPDQPVLHAPNEITGDDFAGWVQERGLYFASRWDARYQAVLRMHDPGEAPLDGGILWARHGKGVFVYTGLAFFRQLPAGVPGAFRLFANLLATGQAPHAR
jgi:LmbE family N-acetylglucosaminyl deacetylase